MFKLFKKKVVSFTLAVAMMTSTMGVANFTQVKAAIYSPGYANATVMLYPGEGSFSTGESVIISTGTKDRTMYLGGYESLVVAKEGYDFVGWGNAYEDRAIYSTKALFNPQENTSLYAKYKKANKTITYDYNWVKANPVKDYVYSIDDNYEVLCPKYLTRPGFKLLGWSEDKFARVATYNNGTATKNPEANVTYYAIWEPVMSGEGKIDNWAYSNYFPSALDKKDYMLTELDYVRLFGSAKGLQLYKDHVDSENSFGVNGVCYGMSITEAQYLENNKVLDFYKAKSMSELTGDVCFNRLVRCRTSEGITIFKYLQYAWRYQTTSDAQKRSDYINFRNSVEKINNNVNNIFDKISKGEDGSKHYSFGVYLYKDKSIEGNYLSHALLGIATGDEMKDELGIYKPVYVYDCNVPNELQTIKFYKNEEGKYYRYIYDAGYGKYDSNNNNKSDYPEYVGIRLTDATGMWEEAYKKLQNKQNWSDDNEAYVSATGSIDVSCSNVTEIFEEEGNTTNNSRYWCNKKNIKLSNIKKNEKVSITDTDSTVSIVAKKNTTLKVSMSANDTVEVDAANVKSINYTNNGKKYSVKPSGKGKLNLKMGKTKMEIKKSKKASLKVVCNKKSTKIKKNSKKAKLKISKKKIKAMSLKKKKKKAKNSKKK